MYGIKIMLQSFNAKLLIEVSSQVNEIIKSFNNIFPKRYIPKYLVREYRANSYDAKISWKVIDRGFRVKKIQLGYKDFYEISSSIPEAYTNEAPFFFILQVFSRLYEKKGFLLFTDSVSFYDPENDKTALILGYPHAGKSTVLAIALSRGLVPLTTENTVLRVRNGLEIIGGTRVLVVDPVALKIYGIPLESELKTRHGYLLFDLEGLKQPRSLKVSSIYLIYCSFNSKGVGVKRIKGRKFLKILWNFSSAIIRGLDYYSPIPLNLSTSELDKQRIKLLVKIMEQYSERFLEVFGSHLDVFNYIRFSKL